MRRAAAGEALLAEIYAHPDDDRPRAVYADWLLDRGDPRGELIALQLARGAGTPPKARERALLREHARAWTGSLGPLLDPDHPLEGAFERGFLADVTLRADVAPATVDDPAVATLRAVRLEARTAADGAALAHPRWGALRELRGLSWAALGALAATPRPLALERIGIRDRDALPRTLPRTRTLAALRTLDLWELSHAALEPAVSAFARSPLVKSLETLGLPQEPAGLGGWIRAFATTRTRRFALVDHELLEFSLLREPKPHFWIRAPYDKRLWRSTTDALVARRLPRALVAQLRVACDPAWDSNPEAKHALHWAVRGIHPRPKAVPWPTSA